MGPLIEANRPGRCVAIYPGAFRPPHIDHHAIVCALAGSDDIDEVVIVVANRLRDIPHTTKVLGPELAVAVWEIFLQHEPKVRVEIAAGSAVRHALAMVADAHPGDSVLLCVGEKDFQDGRGRFRKLEVSARAEGVTVRIECGVTNIIGVSGTELRAALGNGEVDRELFLQAMPAHLGDEQKSAAWNLCREAMVERAEVMMSKVLRILEDKIGPVRSIEATGAASSDSTLRVVFEGDVDRPVFVKHSADTVSAVAPDDDRGRKPRKRVKAEREAIKWVRAVACPDVEVPEVLLFDKRSRTLVLSNVCPGSTSLEELLDDEGSLDRAQVAAMAAAAAFLARCHAAEPPDEPLWDDFEADVKQWRAMLDRVTVDCSKLLKNKRVASALTDLRLTSDAARRYGFVHLDLMPKNVLVGPSCVGCIDFERSSSIGDPAFDIGLLIGHLMHLAIRRGDPAGLSGPIVEALSTYRIATGAQWDEMAERVTSFVAAGLLDATRRAESSIDGDVVVICETLFGMRGVTGSLEAVIDAALTDLGAG